MLICEKGKCRQRGAKNSGNSYNDGNNENANSNSNVDNAVNNSNGSSNNSNVSPNASNGSNNGNNSNSNSANSYLNNSNSDNTNNQNSTNNSNGDNSSNNSNSSNSTNNNNIGNSSNNFNNTGNNNSTNSSNNNVSNNSSAVNNSGNSQNGTDNQNNNLNNSSNGQNNNSQNAQNNDECQPTSHEICDNIDNDCNDLIDDNLQRACSNACGNGMEECVEGTWENCSAPTSCECHQGEVDESPCGDCGTKSRECESSGNWGPYSSCVDPGHECPVYGNKSCLDQKQIELCSDTDNNGCFELVDAEQCRTGAICQLGACVEGCVDNNDCLSNHECVNSACVCLPDCANKDCGDNGCGGSCGSCNSPPDNYCSNSNNLVAYYQSGICNSSGKCDYSVNSVHCAYGCENALCLQCSPDCVNKECGDNGCGGSCGLCNFPPSDICLNSKQLKKHVISGLCENSNNCIYDHEVLNCSYGCFNDSCSECLPNCLNRTCGDDGCGGYCNNTFCGNNPSINKILTIVGNIFFPGNSDSMLTINPDERPGEHEFYGALAYLAANEAEGFTPLYRLHNYNASSGDDADHMASTDRNEGASVGYRNEQTLGYLYQAEFMGSSPLNRYRGRSFTDHSAGFGHPASYSYILEHLLGHAFPRFGLKDKELVTLSGSQLEIKANRVAGGAIWELNWNGKKFINTWDFGRQLQIAFQLNGKGEADNPTEAGDRHATPNDLAGWRHGSPIRNVEINNNVLETSCFPLQWIPSGFYNSETDYRSHPVIWMGTIGKKVEVDFDNMPNVIKWTTIINFPQDQLQLNIELTTAYLNGDFTRFYTYDSKTEQLLEKTDLIPSQGCVDPSADPDQRPEAGGVIIATSDGNYALGVYRNKPMSNHEGYGLCKFLNGSGTGPDDNPTSKWNLLERPVGGLSAGSYSWEMYVVAGTLSDTVNAMNNLFSKGY